MGVIVVREGGVVGIVFEGGAAGPFFFGDAPHEAAAFAGFVDVSGERAEVVGFGKG